MTTETKTRGQLIAADICALLRARNPLLWIVTKEEARAEAVLFEASAAAGYVPRTWDVAQGFCDLAGKQITELRGSEDPGQALTVVGNRSQNTSERGVWIMRDLPVWLEGAVGIHHHAPTAQPGTFAAWCPARQGPGDHHHLAESRSACRARRPCHGH